MKIIKITDSTLCKKNNTFTFKEKLEIARQLDKLNVDVIEFPEIENIQADSLLAKTVSTFAKNSTISIIAGIGENSLKYAIEALNGIENSRICIQLPLSPVGMEYTCHKKGNKMIEHIKSLVTEAKQNCKNVEFCAEDATRAEEDFLFNALCAAKECGADTITISDAASDMLPNDYADFIKKIIDYLDVPVGVKCDNHNSLAIAESLLAVSKGACSVKTQVDGEIASTDEFLTLMGEFSVRMGIKTNINSTNLHIITKQISRIISNLSNTNEKIDFLQDSNDSIRLNANDTKETINEVIKKLGYDLSEDDLDKVYESFLHTAQKKEVGSRELDAIIASEALQVPATYKLVNYVINTGNIFSASAQITLDKGGNNTSGICIGDGPIDAAFAAIEQITGSHYELTDFQIQTVTKGQEAMGSALVKLNYRGKYYSGTGTSTDILSASIRAYLSAVNKIVYELS